MHLLIPVDCASSCAFSVLSVALVGLLVLAAWAFRLQSGKLSVWGILTLENLPRDVGHMSPKFNSGQHHGGDHKVSLEMVEAQRRTVYESQPPVSMAKMIMSRHTFRKPTPKAALPPPLPRICAPQQVPPLALPPPRRSRSLSPPRQTPPSPRQPLSTMV